MQPGRKPNDSVTPWEYAHAEREGHHAYLVPVFRRLLSTIPRGARVFDMGCGSGFLCGELISDGYAVTGVDASQSGITTAQKAFPTATFILASVTDASLPDRIQQRFDVIVSMETIEHLYSPALFLRNCVALLRPGGSFIVSTPYHGYLKYLALAVAGKMDRHMQPTLEGGHIKFWSRKSLASAFNEAGLEVTDFVGCGRVPGLWKSMVMKGVSRGDATNT